MAADAGKFECQVSTQPKMSRTYSLNVVGKPNVNVIYCLYCLKGGRTTIYHCKNLGYRIKVSQYLAHCLTFLVPAVKILGDREVHANAGTALTVRCLISNVLSAPSYVFWDEEKELSFISNLLNTFYSLWSTEYQGNLTSTWLRRINVAKGKPSLFHFHEKMLYH